MLEFSPNSAFPGKFFDVKINSIYLGSVMQNTYDGKWYLLQENSSLPENLPPFATKEEAGNFLYQRYQGTP